MVIMQALVPFLIALFAFPTWAAGNSSTPRGGTMPTAGSSVTTGAIAPPQAPFGIVLPQTCTIVGPTRVVGDDVFEWWLDCGPEGNRASRATFGAVLEQQGWSSCGSGLAAARWWKDGRTTTVTESEGPSSPFRVIQGPRGSECP
jgi:hypothetical protein